MNNSNLGTWSPLALAALLVCASCKQNDDAVPVAEPVQTSTGKSVVSKLPLIAQESMLIGQTWGANLAQSVATELQNAAGAGAAGAAPAVGSGTKPSQP